MLLTILICLVMPPVIIYSGLKMMWPTKKDPNAKSRMLSFAARLVKKRMSASTHGALMMIGVSTMIAA